MKTTTIEINTPDSVDLGVSDVWYVGFEGDNTPESIKAELMSYAMSSKAVVTKPGEAAFIQLREELARRNMPMNRPYWEQVAFLIELRSDAGAFTTIKRIATINGWVDAGFDPGEDLAATVCLYIRALTKYNKLKVTD